LIHSLIVMLNALSSSHLAWYC